MGQEGKAVTGGLFRLTVKHLYFLRDVPLLPHVFEAILKLESLLFRPQVFRCISGIEEEVRSWEQLEIGTHIYGGIQFNAGKREVGHLHGNGVLDLHFTKRIAQELIADGRVLEHHTLPCSGWVTYEIRSLQNKEEAIRLLRSSYQLKVKS